MTLRRLDVPMNLYDLPVRGESPVMNPFTWPPPCHLCCHPDVCLRQSNLHSSSAHDESVLEGGVTEAVGKPSAVIKSLRKLLSMEVALYGTIGDEIV